MTLAVDRGAMVLMLCAFQWGKSDFYGMALVLQLRVPEQCTGLMSCNCRYHSFHHLVSQQHFCGELHKNWVTTVNNWVIAKYSLQK